jgi:citrate synthase
VNIDGALAVALSSLRLEPAYGDVFFALARGFGLAAHYVEEETRGRPMRTIDPTAARYDGP